MLSNKKFIPYCYDPLNGLYFCDPEKNNQCSKQWCFFIGGPCISTRCKDFAINETGKISMLMLFKSESYDEVTINNLRMAMGLRPLWELPQIRRSLKHGLR